MCVGECYLVTEPAERQDMGEGSKIKGAALLRQLFYLLCVLANLFSGMLSCIIQHLPPQL